MNQLTSPVQPSQRIQIIDIWRGFAIFGIFLVNLELFNHAFVEFSLGLEADGLLNQVARWLIAFFGEGKFYSIFAFLFGLGFAMQQKRAAEKDIPFKPFYFRRMLVLLAFGIVHAYLFWVGDILMLYSLMGTILLLFFRNRRPRTLLIWVFVLLTIPLLINGALWGLATLGRMSPGGEDMMALVFAETERSYQEQAQSANEIYATGTFVEITQQRVRDMTFHFTAWIFMGFNVLAMFVLGLYAGQQELHKTIQENRPLLRQTLLWGLGIGLIGNLLYVVFGEMGSRIQPSLTLMILLFGQTFGAPALGMGYLSALAILAQNETWGRWLAHLAPVGRMGLTNYLLQSVICVTLFYGYGFGLYGRIGPAAGILLTMAIFAVQVALSRWWLNHYRFGPVEWLWRSLTYRRYQPLRLPVVPQ